MSKRIYVGNLPWSVTFEKLKELFSPFGDIEEALVIADKYTGRSRGFGFVTFKNEEDADKAIEDMNEKDVEGRSLVVKEAMPLEERKPTERKEGSFKEKRPREKKERKPRKESREENFEEE